MLIATIFFMFFSSLIYAQDSNRYTDSLFNFNQEITDGIYANALELNKPYQGENSTHAEDLKFHLFAPEDDTLKLRPLIICIHGGGFISGNKEHDDMMEFCKVFAQRGYVTATIQYRLGVNFFSASSSERAVYRGVQDGRAAIRYFKENANLYGIDTNSVYLLGSSAGAFVSLHNLFLNEESERPAGTYDAPDLGSLDAINPTLKHGSHPNGVISLWGAIQSPELIKPMDGNIPLFLVHGTTDSTVPFDVGHPFGLPTLPKTYGSKVINEHLINLGFNNNTYFVPNKGHEFYGVSNGMWRPAPNAYWDTVVTKSTNFLWNLHKPEANFDLTNEDNMFYFTDNSIKATKWEWHFGDGEISDKQNPSHFYYNYGEYKVTLLVKNEIESWDTTSSVVIAPMIINVEKEENLPTKFELAQNYPNPFNPATTIKYSIPVETHRSMLPQNVILKVFDILGREVATLVNKEQSAGNYEVTFNARNLTSGMYFYKLETPEFSKIMKMILIK